MRFTKKIIASALAVCLGAAMGVMPAMAAEVTIDPYKYQVLLYPGDGTIGGNSDARLCELNGGYAEIDYSGAVPNDDRYYVKGVRLAGLDNSNAIASPDEVLNLPTEGDAQYVVAYGLKKNQVAYTVNFVDAAGNEIATSETLYGNPGDKPVVAFRYIDGYLPTTYNLTKTLSDNASENVFTFTYNAAPGVTYTVIDNGITMRAAAAGGAGAAPAGPAAVADAAAAGEILGDDGTPLAAPTEIEDIDDNDNPLASGVEPGSEAAASFDMSIVLIAVGAVLLIAIIAGAAVALRKRNKKATESK